MQRQAVPARRPRFAPSLGRTLAPHGLPRSGQLLPRAPLQPVLRAGRNGALRVCPRFESRASAFPVLLLEDAGEGRMFSSGDPPALSPWLTRVPRQSQGHMEPTDVTVSVPVIREP